MTERYTLQDTRYTTPLPFSEPRKVVGQVGLREGMVVADFGSGSGHYTLAAAKAVGDTGRVYAIDIQQALLKNVKNLSSREHRRNIEVVWGDVEKQGGAKIREHSVDVVFLTNILFQLDHKEGVLGEAKRVLKPQGRLLIVDWTSSFSNMGPPPERVFQEGAARELAEGQGFRFEKRIDAGAHHYGLVFQKS